MSNPVSTQAQCPDEAALLDFVNGGLDGTPRAELEAHIDRCASCFDAVAVALAAPADSSVRERGESTGRYTVLRVLGEGAMGTVYAGYDPVLDRTVALKILRRDLRPTEERKARLLREAQVLAKIRHRNVVSVYDAGESGDTVYLAMELVEGAAMGEHLAAERPSWRDVLGLFVGAGEGLAAAHEAGLVHRDFKPSNVLVTRDGRVVVTDFGLAAMATDGGQTLTEAPLTGSLLDTRITVSRATMGTPLYMAPELFGDRSASPASDQFAFCVALIEALTGDRPFAGKDIGELRAAHRKGPNQRVLGRIPGPASLRRALTRGTAVEPAERHASMPALLLSLRRSAGQRRNVAIGAGALAIVAALSVWWAQDRRVPPACETPLRAAWGDARRAEVEAAVQATTRASGRRAVERIDAYAERLHEVYAEVCRGLPHDVDDAAPGPRAQWGCVESRRVGLDALTARIAQGDAKPIAGLIAGLDDVAPCRSPGAAMRASPVPDDPELARRVLALRLELAAMAPAIDGIDARIVDELVALEERAATVPYPPVVAEIVYQSASVRASLGRTDDAVADAERAYEIASKSRHERVARMAATSLVTMMGSAERWSDGEVWLQVAEPLQRSEADRAWLAWIRGGFEFARRDYAASRTHFERALALVDSTPDPRQMRIRIDSDYGLALQKLGEYREALVVLGRALQVRRELLGSDHIRVARDLANIGAIEIWLKDDEAGIPHLEEALEIVGNQPSPPATFGATINLSLGLARGNAERWDQADAHLDEAARHASGLLRARIRRTKAGFAISRGDFAEGLAACDDAVAEAHRAASREHPLAIELEAKCLSYAAHANEVDADRLERARTMEALVPSPVRDADLATHAWLQWTLGLGAIASGEHERAVARLEEGVSAARRRGFSVALPMVDLARAQAPPAAAGAAVGSAAAKARATLAEALAACAEMAPSAAAAVRLRAARLEADWGRVADARALATAARDAAKVAGARGLEAQAADFLLQLPAER